MKIKTKSIIQNGKEVPRTINMKLGVVYTVQNVFKYRDRETQKFITHFLCGDPETGNIFWVSSEAVDYVGD